jgi:hypothetical protein
VIRVARDAVRAESQHGVRAHVFDQVSQPLDRVRLAGLGALAVTVPEPVVLGDAENVQAACQLAGSLGRQPLRRPGHRVRSTELASGGGNTHHP